MRFLLLSVGTLLMLTPAAAAALQAFPLTASPTEISAAEARIRPAVVQLERAASKLMAEAGEAYTTPRIVGFETSIRSACGIVRAGNAYACRADGSVYYDRTLTAALMFGAARALRTDGDMAAVNPIAHEWGHMLQYMLVADYTSAPTRSESDADCLAGVLTARLQGDNVLVAGDIDEERWAMQAAGDAPLATGVWGNVIERINLNAAPGSIPVITNARGEHGNSRERLQAFNRGLGSTIAGCTAGVPRPGLRATAVVAPSIHWYVNDLATAYDRGVAENKPIVFVSGDFNGPYFNRLKNETLQSPVLTQLASYAIFAYSDPARDLVARNIGKALGYERTPVISLLAPNPQMLDEASRIVGLFDAPTVLNQLSIHLKQHGWMGVTRAPWLPPLPGR